MNRRVTITAGLLLATLASTPDAVAHDVRPAYFEATETTPGRLTLLWKVPVLGEGTPLAGDEDAPRTRPGEGEPSRSACDCPAEWSAVRTAGALPAHASLPAKARLRGPVVIERRAGVEIRRAEISVPAPSLSTWDLTIHGLAGTSVDALVRVSLLESRPVTVVLRPEQPRLVVRRGEGGTRTAPFFRLGVEHILLGYDHLAFVLCLLLLVRGGRRIFATITAFTLAHSATLALATLGVLRVPSAPVEALIAASIVLLAAEVAARANGRATAVARRPWTVAFAFGLLHGLGFAGALADVGLPAADVPLTLALFNVGVEAGQLAFVGAVLVVVAALRLLPIRLPVWTRRAPAYALGTLACAWFFARVAALG